VKVRGVGFISAVVLLAIAASPQRSESKAQKDPAARTKVVLLGAGTPSPIPIVPALPPRLLLTIAYLVDFGPGVVRRAEAAALKGVTAVEPGNLKVAFVTHLHSDHTAGYSDLILTGWTSGRTIPL
jgi:ribonuclease BN (tRNA processing enzyme)